MNYTNIWLIKSKHVNPNDFYVKTDGSNFYIAYWVATAIDKSGAESLVCEASSELVLGNVEIISGSLYSNDVDLQDEKIKERVKEYIGKLMSEEDVQLAAWISEKGGLW